MAKAKAKKQEEVKELLLPYSVLSELDTLIGRFTIRSFDEIENITAKRNLLRQENYKFYLLHNGDGVKASELWFTSSELKKIDLAFLELEGLMHQVKTVEKQFTLDQIELMKYWLVK